MRKDSLTIMGARNRVRKDNISKNIWEKKIYEKIPLRKDYVTQKPSDLVLVMLLLLMMMMTMKTTRTKCNMLCQFGSMPSDVCILQGAIFYVMAKSPTLFAPPRIRVLHNQPRLAVWEIQFVRSIFSGAISSPVAVPV